MSATGAYASGMSRLNEIRPGLWRWTSSHPEWVAGAAAASPADWPQVVGSVLCNATDTTVLVDPLVPPGDDRLRQELDHHVGGRGMPVAILTTIKFHRRSRDELAGRYSACTSRARRSLPAGVQSLPIRGAGETMFWLSEHRALIPGDRILGTPGGGLRLCPESWLRYLPSGLSVTELGVRLRHLLDLPIETVLVSHGDPVVTGGRRALAEALDRA